MNYVVYQFEAVSIQEYIMASSKLKEMVGASQLLDVLTGELLNMALKEIGLITCDLSSMSALALNEDDVVFPRRSGGVFLAVMVDGEKADLFKKLWALLVQQLAPTLKFAVAIKKSENIKLAIKMVRQQLNAEKNTPKITLPEMTPLTMRSPRTGGAVIKTQNGVSIDLATQVKQQTQNQADTLFQAINHRWLPKGVVKTFPTVFDHTKESTKEIEFPFSGREGEHTVAIVHADGNGIGQYIQRFFNKIDQDNVSDLTFLNAYAAFSQGLDHATQFAAQEAMSWLISTYEQKEGGSSLPIRPLILSGDDITCIIRSDYAFEFMQKLTQEFEAASEKALKKLSIGREVFPAYLTMTTGIVFLRSNQPFYMGYQLAEDLCSHSKNLGRNSKNQEGIIPSTLTFVHATSTLFDSAHDFIQGELTTSEGLKLTNEVYLLGKEKSPIAPFSVLKEMSDCFSDEKLNISFIRKLATTLQLDTAHAKQMIKRWKEISEPSHIEPLETLLNTHFNISSLEALCENNNPIGDLIVYQNLRTGVNHD